MQHFLQCWCLWGDKTLLMKIPSASSVLLNKLYKSGSISGREDEYCWEPPRACETASRGDDNSAQFSVRRWGNTLLCSVTTGLLCQAGHPGGLATTWASSTTTWRPTPPGPSLGPTSWRGREKLSSASRGKHQILPAPSKIWAIWR